LIEALYSDDLGRCGWLAFADLLDDAPLKLVFRAVAFRADLEEAGFVVGSQPSDLRRRQLRSALAYDARRHFSGCAWRHVDVRFKEEPEGLVEPKLFVNSDCVHGHSGSRLWQGRKPDGALPDVVASLVIQIMLTTPPGSRVIAILAVFFLAVTIA
jgi:hypothetical protein